MRKSTTSHIVVDEIFKTLEAELETLKESCVSYALSHEQYHQTFGKAQVVKELQESFQDIIKKHFPEYYDN